MLDSDCIIYDLTNCDVKECEFAIKTLKMNEFSDTKFFYNIKRFLICVSSVLSWSNTLPKERTESDDPELADEESETEE